MPGRIGGGSGGSSSGGPDRDPVAGGGGERWSTGRRDRHDLLGTTHHRTTHHRTTHHRTTHHRTTHHRTTHHRTTHHRTTHHRTTHHRTTHHTTHHAPEEPADHRSTHDAPEKRAGRLEPPAPSPVSTTPTTEPPVTAAVPKPRVVRAHTTTTTTPPASAKPNDASPSNKCQADPAAAIEALPSGGVFHGSGCYETSGILVTKPVTIDGGTYDDPVDTNTGPGSVLPIIRVKNTTDVTIENVVLNGSNYVGGFHRDLVGQAGLDILSSSDVSILNVATNDTLGDGMTLFSQFGVDKAPVTDLYVNGLTVTRAGRQGITMGYVEDSTLDNVNLVSAADAGWDFESDLANVGSGNVTINNAHDQKGIHIIEALQGPITFNDCQCEQHVHMLNDAAASGQLVTFNGGSYELDRDTDTGCNVAGIMIAGPGRMDFNDVDITRMPGEWAPQGPAISVTDGGHLTLVNSPLPAPVGGADATSRVTIER